MTLLNATLAVVVLFGLVGLESVDAQSENETYPSITIYVDKSQEQEFDIYRSLGFPEFSVVPILNLLQIEQQINTGLPGTEEEAAPIALQRVRELEPYLKKAWEQALFLEQLNITHLPAIVFNNDEFIWYGYRLDQALELYWGE